MSVTSLFDNLASFGILGNSKLVLLGKGDNTGARTSSGSFV